MTDACGNCVDFPGPDEICTTCPMLRGEVYYNDIACRRFRKAKQTIQ